MWQGRRGAADDHQEVRRCARTTATLLARFVRCAAFYSTFTSTNLAEAERLCTIPVLVGTTLTRSMQLPGKSVGRSIAVCMALSHLAFCFGMAICEAHVKALPRCLMRISAFWITCGKARRPLTGACAAAPCHLVCSHSSPHLHPCLSATVCVAQVPLRNNSGELWPVLCAACSGGCEYAS